MDFIKVNPTIWDHVTSYAQAEPLAAFFAMVIVASAVAYKLKQKGNTMNPDHVSFVAYRAELEQALARYGFTSNPLTVGEMFQMHKQGITLGDAYGIACDANAQQDYFDVQESINLVNGI